MSHKAVTKVERWDENALREALLELDARVEENVLWRAYQPGENTGVAFMVSQVNNRHLLGDRRMYAAGIGFRKIGETLELVIDDLDAQKPQVAAFLKEFKRCYTEKAAANLLASYGYRVTKLPDGTYRATATAKTVAALSRQQTQAPTKRVQRVRF